MSWRAGLTPWHKGLVSQYYKVQIVMSHDHQDLKGEPASGPVDFVEPNLQPATLWTWRDTGQT